MNKDRIMDTALDGEQPKGRRHTAGRAAYAGSHEAARDAAERQQLGPKTKFGDQDPADISRPSDASVAHAARAERYALLSVARRALPRERVAKCHRVLLEAKTRVDVLYSPSKQSARYRNLLQCGSVWLCPVCAARMNVSRCRELTAAASAWQGAGHALVKATYTVRHSRADNLDRLVDSMILAWGDMHRSSGYKEIRRRWNPWMVRTLEVTWSPRDGWHPHYHAMLFVESEAIVAALPELGTKLLSTWQLSAQVRGLEVSTERGLKVAIANARDARYLTKFGRVIRALRLEETAAGRPSPETGNQGDGDVHYDPFDLLGWSLTTGRTHPPLTLFRAYAETFKGLNQHRWSRGMRKALFRAEVADQETSEEQEDDAYLLTTISVDEWRAVLYFEKRAEVLRIASTGDEAAVRAFVESLSDDLRRRAA